PSHAAVHPVPALRCTHPLTIPPSRGRDTELPVPRSDADRQLRSAAASETVARRGGSCGDIPCRRVISKQGDGLFLVWKSKTLPHKPVMLRHRRTTVPTREQPTLAFTLPCRVIRISGMPEDGLDGM